MGDDCVEKYVACSHEVPQLFPPGEQFSYNNAGYCVLGRLVEVLRGKPYDACLREHLFAPLGLTHAATGAYEAILFRAAVGPHRARARRRLRAGAGLGDGPLQRAGRLDARDAPARPASPSPGCTSRTARPPTAPRCCAPAPPPRMQAAQVELPDLGLMGTSWGLGFERFDTADGAVVGHDGNTIGQAAFLRMVPEAGVAVALLTNGGDAFSLYRDVVGHVLEELGRRRPARASRCRRRTPSRSTPSRYVGTYSAEVFDLTVSQDDDGRIWIEQIPKGIVRGAGRAARAQASSSHYRERHADPARRPTAACTCRTRSSATTARATRSTCTVGRAVRRAGA